MPEFLQVLLLSLLPAAGNFAGGALAEFTRTSKRTLSLALHGAAGIIFGVIAIELAPRAFDGAPGWIAALGFLAGGILYIGMGWIVDRLQSRSSDQTGSNSSSAWMIYAAVSIDLFSDGLLIGIGSSLSFNLALVLAIGQVTADIPEGFAAIANFKGKLPSRSKRLLLSASFVVPVVVGALVSFYVLRERSESIQLAALALVAGLLLAAATEDIIGEAHEAIEDSKSSVLAIVGGFVLFALVSTYLG